MLTTSAAHRELTGPEKFSAAIDRIERQLRHLIAVRRIDPQNVAMHVHGSPPGYIAGLNTDGRWSVWEALREWVPSRSISGYAEPSDAVNHAAQLVIGDVLDGDATLSNESPLKLAADAIGYTLRRVISCPDFRWQMAGTECLERLATAHAALTAQTADEVRDQIQRGCDAQPYEQIGQPKLVELRQQIAELQKARG